MTYKEAIKAIRDNYPPSHYSILREALDMAIEALEEIERHEETFEWCGNCKEYDQNEHCCHRWTKCIRDVVDTINETANGCVDCVFIDVEEWKMPCVKCKRKSKDYWRMK